MQPCVRPDEAGCLLSWQTFSEPANPKLLTDAWVGTTGLSGSPRRRDEMLCVNPLDGKKDGSVLPSSNSGALDPDGALSNATIWQGPLGATCKDGFLIVTGQLPKLGPYVLPGNNYHVYDYALFWGSIRADAERRLAAWQSR
jgi:hypothetical protein